MKFHNTLNPKLWDKWQEKHIGGKVTYHLKKDVAAKLKEIANAFIEYLEVDKEAIKDVVITGSSASFNYTSHSDLDLHLKVDYDLIHEDCPIVEGYLWALKSTFNKDHDISIYGIPVEVYAESIDSDTVHNGLFSLWNMRWIDEPKPIPPTDNDMAVKAKYEEIKEASDRVKDSELAEQLINKIYEMRKAGLQEVGEFSTENLAFKKLRDAGVLERLKAMKKEKVDKELSLESYNEGLAPATGDLAVFTKRLFGLNLKPDKNFIRQTDYKLDLEHADAYIKKDIGYDCPGIVYQIRDKQDNIIKEVKWTDIYNTSEEYDKTINYLYKYGSMQEIAYVLKLANPNASEDTINKKLQELQTHGDKSRRIKSHMYFDGNTWQNESINKLEETLKKAQDKKLSLESYNETVEQPTQEDILNWLIKNKIKVGYGFNRMNKQAIAYYMFKLIQNLSTETINLIRQADFKDFDTKQFTLDNRSALEINHIVPCNSTITHLVCLYLNPITNKTYNELPTVEETAKRSILRKMNKLYDHKTQAIKKGYFCLHKKDNNVEIQKYLGKGQYDTIMQASTYEELNKMLDRQLKQNESIDTDLLKRDEKFRYMMLDRMRQDCNYYLEHPHEKHLWAGNVEDQIETMKQLYDSLSEKPEWITMEEIEDLEKQMLNLKNNKNEDVNTLCDKIDNVEKDLEDMVKLVKPQVLMKNEAYNKLRKVVCEALEETEFDEFKVGSKVKIGNTWNARQGTITNITNDVATVEIEETPDNMARTDKFYLQDLQLV